MGKIRLKKSQERVCFMKMHAMRHNVGAVICDVQGVFLILDRATVHWKGWGLVKGGIEEGERILLLLQRFFTLWLVSCPIIFLA